MPPTNAEVLKRAEVRDGRGESLAESFREGNGRATWDGVAVARGEGFRLEDIQTEVPIWHGEQDRNDPVEMAARPAPVDATGRNRRQISV